MQNLREQLLKAGLVTKEQVDRSQTKPKRKKKSGNKTRRGQNPSSDKVPQRMPGASKHPSSKDSAHQPVNRMLDVSNPKTLEIIRAIEEHRIREQTEGDRRFHFTLRDGRVRKLFVNDLVAQGLESGNFPIVENGAADQHIIVSSEAVAAIRDADSAAVRFHND